MTRTPRSAPPAVSPTLPQALSTRYFLLGAGVVLLALSFLPAAGALSSPFLSYDDPTYIRDNPLFRPERDWLEPFRGHYNSIYMPLPLPLLSYRINLLLLGPEAAWSFRVVNVLLHFAAGCFLLGVFRVLGLGRFESLFLSGAWTAHPIACESTAWACQRHSSMAACFSFFALWAYLRWHGQWRGLLLGAAGQALALFSKPTALSLLPILLAVECLGGPERLAQTPKDWEEHRGTLPNWAGLGIRLLPFLGLTGLFAALALDSGGSRLVPPPGGWWGTALLTDTEILVRYLANTFAPTRLSAFYGIRDITSLADPRLLLNILLLAAAAGASLWAARQRRRAALGWLWFLGGLIPHANLVGISFVMADRYLYLAAPGLLLAGLETILGLRQRWAERGIAPGQSPAPSRTLALLGLIYLLFLGTLAFERGRLWSGAPLDEQGAQPVDPLDLFAQSVSREPECGLARAQYGLVLAKEAARLRGLKEEPAAARALGLSAAAATQLSQALTCPDFYRYFDPLRIRVSLAREAVRIGQPARAIQALEGFLPPPPAGEPARPLSSHELAQGFRLTRLGGHPYRYKLQTLADGYASASDAALLEAEQAGGQPQRRQELERALRWAEEGVAAWPRNSDGWWQAAQANLRLMEWVRREGQQDEALRRLAQAREALQRIGPESGRHAMARWLLERLKTQENGPGTASQEGAPPRTAPRAGVPEGTAPEERLPQGTAPQPARTPEKGIP